MQLLLQQLYSTVKTAISIAPRIVIVEMYNILARLIVDLYPMGDIAHLNNSFEKY